MVPPPPSMVRLPARRSTLPALPPLPVAFATAKIPESVWVETRPRDLRTCPETAAVIVPPLPRPNVNELINPATLHRQTVSGESHIAGVTARSGKRLNRQRSRHPPISASVPESRIGPETFKVMSPPLPSPNVVELIFAPPSTCKPAASR